MTLNELFARFDKLAAVRVLGLGAGWPVVGAQPGWQQPGAWRQIETAVRAVGLRRGGQESKVTLPQLFSLLGKSLPEDQDLRGLLLLRVRIARGPDRPRPLLCGDGGGHDRGHLVSSTPPRLPGTEGAPDCSYPLICFQGFSLVWASFCL